MTSIKTRLAGITAALAVGAMLLTGCVTTTAPRPSQETVTVTATPSPAEETPSATPVDPEVNTTPDVETRSGDAVFVEGFVQFFGTTPTPELVLAAREVADSSSAAYAAGATVEEILTSFLEGWTTSEGSSQEDGITVWVLAVTAYGSPELNAAVQAATS